MPVAALGMVIAIIVAVAVLDYMAVVTVKRIVATAIRECEARAVERTQDDLDAEQALRLAEQEAWRLEVLGLIEEVRLLIQALQQNDPEGMLVRTSHRLELVRNELSQRG